MSIRNKKIKLEATFDEWSDMVSSLDHSCDMLMMFRKLVKANIEAKGAKELAKQLPELVMQFQEQISFLKTSIMKAMTHKDVQALADEALAKMESGKSDKSDD